MSELSTGRPAVALAEKPTLYIEEIIASVALAIVVASVSWGVLTRYALERPANWTSELSAICFAWAVFVGAAAAFRRGGPIAIDAFVDLLPTMASRILRIAAATIVFATLLTMTVLATRLTLSTTDVPTTVLRLPQAVIYAAAACGFALMTLRHAVSSVRQLRQGGDA